MKQVKFRLNMEAFANRKKARVKLLKEEEANFGKKNFSMMKARNVVNRIDKLVMRVELHFPPKILLCRKFMNSTFSF